MCHSLWLSWDLLVMRRACAGSAGLTMKLEKLFACQPCTRNEACLVYCVGFGACYLESWIGRQVCVSWKVLATWQWRRPELDVRNTNSKIGNWRDTDLNLDRYWPWTWKSTFKVELNLNLKRFQAQLTTCRNVESIRLPAQCKICGGGLCDIELRKIKVQAAKSTAWVIIGGTTLQGRLYLDWISSSRHSCKCNAMHLHVETYGCKIRVFSQDFWALCTARPVWFINQLLW